MSLVNEIACCRCNIFYLQYGAMQSIIYIDQYHHSSMADSSDMMVLAM